MFEQEEKKLKELGEEFEKVSIPSVQLDDAIQKGFNSGELALKKQRRQRQKLVWNIAAVAILLLTFTVSIRISPAFAKTVSSIPGMELIVELIQDNKGLQEIMNNDYYQAVHASQSVDGITMTIDGVILDETGILISHQLEAPYAIKDIEYDEIRLYNAGEKIEYATMTYNYSEQNHNHRKVDLIEFIFQDGNELKSNEFSIEVQLDNGKETTFLIPFTVPEEVKKGKVYPLQQTFEIEGQKIIVEEIIIHPLRVAVKITQTEENTMEILSFEDMRIENEKGEVWSSIKNGVTSIGTDEEYHLYYLQSNYFNQPKELYFKVSEAQALPKEEAFLLVDLANKKVLNQPTIGDFEVHKITSDSIEVRFPESDRPFHSFIFSGVETIDGKPIETDGHRRWNAEGYEQSALEFIDHDPNIPVKIQIFAYPNYIQGDLSIELKQ